MDNKIINANFTFFRAIPDALAALFKKHSESMANIINQPRFSSAPSASEMAQAQTDKQNEITALKKKTFDQLAAVRADLDSRVISTDKYLDRELGGNAPSNDVQMNTLMEIRHGKAWDRIKPILDGKKDIDEIPEVVRGLVADFVNAHDASPNAYDASDYDSIAVLRAELPMYLKGRFPNAQAADGLETALDALETALADRRPEFREALDLRREMKTGVHQIHTALSYVQFAVENNEPDAIIPAWEKGQTANLS